jgi:prolyl oligopeptidase
MGLLPATFALSAHPHAGFLSSRLRPLLIALTCIATACAQTSSLPAPPPTPKRPVTDTYHGVTVVDDYRWLEDGKDPEVQQWTDAQNQRTRAYLDSLRGRPAIEDYFTGMMSSSSGSYVDLRFRGGRLFARKSQPPKQQPLLVVLSSPDGVASERIVVDPNNLAGGSATAIDFYEPSFDGKLLAVSLSQNGTEEGDLHVFEVDTGKQLPDLIPRANAPTAFGDVAWKPDGSGFYYARLPRANERPKEDLNFYEQVYFHKLGSDTTQDRYVIGNEFPRIAEIQFETSLDGHHVLVSVANGDGGEFSFYLLTPSGRAQQIAKFEDRIVSAKFGPDNALYLLSRKAAPRGKLLRLPLSSPRIAKAKVIVPQTPGPENSANEENRASIESFVVTAHRLYVTDVIGGPSRVRIFDLRGKFLRNVPLPPISSARAMLALRRDDVLFLSSTWIQPPGWYRYDASHETSKRTSLFTTSAATFNDAEVLREFATSKDGTRIPVSIVRKRGVQLDGSNPVLLEGYGGYNISMTPKFLGSFGRMWLDQGGVFVMAHLRGGGEYGEAWHQAGNLTRKQNVFDDFIACAEYLVRRKYTSPEHLAIIGGSNGGLLMGAVLTQRPDLFRAVLSYSGVYDSLREELDPNGVYNIPEYGTVKDPEQFKALYAYSPYHHVKEGVRYPAVLLSTGANDGRVNPYQSRKMTARLQAATASSNPILLRTVEASGHAPNGLKQAIQHNTDAFSFIFDQLGMSYKPVPGSRTQMQ